MQYRVQSKQYEIIYEKSGAWDDFQQKHPNTDTLENTKNHEGNRVRCILKSYIKRKESRKYKKKWKNVLKV